MKLMLKQALSATINATGYFDRKIKGHVGNLILVPMYHRIIQEASEDPLAMGMCVSAENFRAQLSYFTKEYDVLTLAEIAQLRSEGKALPERTAAITFDDGYLDNLEVAGPILQEYGTRATLFVSTGFFGSACGFWWDQVINSLLNAKGSNLDTGQFNLPFTSMKLDDANVQQAINQTLEYLWQLPIDDALIIVNQLVNEFGATQPFGPRVMVEKDLTSVEEYFDIGAHTCKHPNLSLISKDIVKQEIMDSKNYLEKFTSKPVTGFAAPGGFTPGYLTELLADCGFDYAATTRRGLNDSSVNLLALERIGMPNSTVSDLKRSIASLA